MSPWTKGRQKGVPESGGLWGQLPDPQPGLSEPLSSGCYTKSVFRPFECPPSEPSGFGTLLHIILEQQVSIDAAAKMYHRLTGLCHPLSPATFLALDDATLRSCGFSRQKMGYARDLAVAVECGSFDFARLEAADDNTAMIDLLAIRGIGRWSAEIYLLFALGRFSSRIRRVIVRLQDLNGQRGGLDKRCHIEAQLSGRGLLVVDVRDMELESAVARAAERIRRRIRDELSKRRTQRNRGRPPKERLPAA